MSAASFAAFFFAALLLGKRPKGLHDQVLFVWLIYLGVFTALYLFSPADVFTVSPWLSTTIISLFLLHGPFLFLYTTVLTTGKKKTSIRDGLHFLPFLLFVIYLAVAFQFSGYAAGITLDHVHTEILPPPLFVVFLLLTAASGPIYFFLSLIQFRKFKRRSQDHFSGPDQANLEWLKILLIIFGVIWTVLIIIAIAHHFFHFSSMDFCINGLFTSLSVFIILMGFFGLKQQEIFSHFPTVAHVSLPIVDERKERSEKYSNVFITNEEFAAYVQQIDQFMKTEKPYLDADLTIGTMADQLGIPIHQLSRVINEHFGRNFFDFINGFRVMEVKRKIADPDYDHFSLLGIAFESGFNSKSAFNRVFKKFTGQTPSTFKNQQAPPPK